MILTSAPRAAAMIPKCVPDFAMSTAPAMSALIGRSGAMYVMVTSRFSLAKKPRSSATMESQSKAVGLVAPTLILSPPRAETGDAKRTRARTAAPGTPLRPTRAR